MSIGVDLQNVFKQNSLPAIVLIVLELSLYIGYTNIPIVTNLFNALGMLKANMSYLFSFLITGIFMGLLPWAYDIYRHTIKPKNQKKQGIFMFLCYGLIGVQTDFFYSIQNEIFGSGLIATIEKMFIDQFIWTLFYMSHLNYWIVWIYKNCQLPKCNVYLIKNYFYHDYLLALFGGYIVWIPSCLILYSMDTSLQIIMMNLVGSFFIIIMQSITSHQQSPESEMLDDVFDLE